MHLLDDASPDKTGFTVKQQFPQVNVTLGSGDLYWAGGVRLILEHIGEHLHQFDAILLANDDIVLKPGSLNTVLEIAFTNQAVVGGTVITNNGQIESSGSLLGRICKPRLKRLIANGELQKCQLLPGHLMLIPMGVYQELNGFDSYLPYRFLDLEFTLRASRSGHSVLLAPDVIATTDEVHDYYRETSSMRGTLCQLVNAILLHPKGPHWRESTYYLQKVSPWLWWLWLPLFYRAFFVAVFRSYFERIPFVRKRARSPLQF